MLHRIYLKIQIQQHTSHQMYDQKEVVAYHFHIRGTDLHQKSMMVPQQFVTIQGLHLLSVQNK